MDDHYAIISRNDCRYCTDAKKLLDEKGIGYTEFNIDEVPKFREFLICQNLRTVPQIFIEGSRIGGYDDLVAYVNVWEEGGEIWGV